ncbi:CDP-glycerol glycerophosphotransferase family protein [Streptomyces sp. NPDC002851]
MQRLHRLSVIVPFCNVEEYLEECLRSIAGQTVTHLDVVLVDDGSTDGSAAIARAFAERDDRFRYVPQERAGLSAARGAGVREAAPGTEYLTFVDGDDVVPHGAWSRMLRSLDATGSDFATGNVWRLHDRGRQQARQYRWLTETRQRTHLTRAPELIADGIAWNKVFRREFWHRVGKEASGDGVDAVDTPHGILAHCLAEAVDVLADHVTYRRERGQGRGTDVRAARDRIAACTTVSRFLADRFPEHKAAYDASCLREDFAHFLEGLRTSGPDYREAFLTDAAAFLAQVAPGVLTGPGLLTGPRLPIGLRAKWQLVREGRYEDLDSLLAFERRSGTAFRVRGGPVRRRTAEWPGNGPNGRLALPRGLTRLSRAELPVVTRAEKATWAKNGTLRITGYAYIRNLAAARPGQSIKLGLLRPVPGSGRHHRPRGVPTRTIPYPQATENSQQALHSYHLSGFEMTLDPERLKTRGRWRPGTWLLDVVVGGHGTLRRAAVRAGEAARSAVRDLDDGLRMVLSVRGDDARLVVSIEQYAARVDRHGRAAEDPAAVVLGGHLHRGGLRPTELRLIRDHSEAVIDCPVECLPGPGRAFTARIPLPDLMAVHPIPHHAPHEVEAPPGEPWRASLVFPDGKLKPVAATTNLPPGHYPTGPTARPLCITADPAGRLRVEPTHCPVADVVRWEGEGRLVVAGSMEPDSSHPELVLRHSTRDEEVTAPVEQTPDGRFRAELTPADARLAPGHWHAYVRGAQETPLRLRTDTATNLPAERTRFTATRHCGDRLLLQVAPDLPPTERGPYHRERLRTTHYPAQRHLPLRDAILYVDGDNPRAVHEELVHRGADLEHLWVTQDQQTYVPATARGVELHSAAWHEALARCRYIVTPEHLPEFFERRDGQTVVQTWHGSPLKRIGTDLKGTAYADHAHLNAVPRPTRQWSVLVTPNRYAIPHMTRALAYYGEILQAGSPRNDVLFAEDRDKIADRVRAELGLAEDDRRVVLYAPTYREHLTHHRQPTLDLAALRAAGLDDDHVLLVRRHPRTTGRITGARAPFVHDVTTYPKPAELLLTADVLITDYSALMFDYAHTGRPMLFHTPDLAHYRDTVRGLYLDFERRAPGPLLSGTDEVVAALRDLDATAARHADAYAAFRQAYCDLDDGRASARVAARLLR